MPTAGEHRQDLDGHVAHEAGIVRTVDVPHAAGPDRAADFIGAQTRSGRQLVWLGEQLFPQRPIEGASRRED